MSFLRAAIRLPWLLGMFAVCGADFIWNYRRKGRTHAPDRAEFLQKWATQTLRIIGVIPRYEGPRPTAGFVVANHLSYVDVLVIAAGSRLAFVSKHEVRRWPIVGPLTDYAGTIFLERSRRSDALRVAQVMGEKLDAGVPVVFFPEGTSSDGSGVLPFHAALFAPAVEAAAAIIPAHVSYALSDGSVGEDVAYWRDMTFATHLIKLLGKRRVEALVRYGEPIPPGMDRKELARAAHAAVCRLGGVSVGGPAAAHTAVATPA
jgi:lyso-ornithine lipid O-acyltransferase